MMTIFFNSTHSNIYIKCIFIFKKPFPVILCIMKQMCACQNMFEWYQNSTTSNCCTFFTRGCKLYCSPEKFSLWKHTYVKTQLSIHFRSHVTNMNSEIFLGEQYHDFDQNLPRKLSLSCIMTIENFCIIDLCVCW